MTRRATLGLLALACAGLGCDDDEGGGVTGAAPSRVVGVQEEDEAPDFDAFCDVHASAGEAKALEMPPLDGEMKDAGEAWRWVNVWATWCKPCIEEMPMLVDWKSKLASDGAPVQLTFVSVDDTAETVEAYREEHPETPESLRLTDQDALEGWLTGLGMDAGATIPLQIFADPEGRARCVRSGAVNPPDYDTVRALLGS